MNFLRKTKRSLTRGINSISNFFRFGRTDWADVVIVKPITITNDTISFGKNVRVAHNGRIEGVKRYNNTQYTPHVEIGDGVYIEQCLHLTCAESVKIGEKTSISAFVTITDIHHGYTDIHTPIEQQDLEVKPVEIGKHCKIYNNTVILPGCKIGDHVTIGANAVVTRDIPSYSVAAGSPARVVKKYNFETKQWEKA